MIEKVVSGSADIIGFVQVEFFSSLKESGVSVSFKATTFNKFSQVTC